MLARCLIVNFPRNNLGLLTAAPRKFDIHEPPIRRRGIPNYAASLLLLRPLRLSLSKTKLLDVMRRMSSADFGFGAQRRGSRWRQFPKRGVGAREISRGKSAARERGQSHYEAIGY